MFPPEIRNNSWGSFWLSACEITSSTAADHEVGFPSVISVSLAVIALQNILFSSYAFEIARSTACFVKSPYSSESCYGFSWSNIFTDSNL